MIIPNEKVYVEEILLSKKKPNNLSIKGLIRYIAKYFYNYCIKERNMNLIEYTGYVLSVMTHFKLPKLEYQEYKYARYTKTYCKNMMAGIFSPTFREVETISFTEDELATINSAVYRKERKVLFTLYALAKIIILTNSTNKAVAPIAIPHTAIALLCSRLPRLTAPNTMDNGARIIPNTTQLKIAHTSDATANELELFFLVIVKSPSYNYYYIPQSV
jgi:hypothetical protein